MTAPPPYPRIPYLRAPEGLAGRDRVVPPGDVVTWFDRPVVVEEKLDGANVTLWSEDGRTQVASRGGVGAMDRGRQLGRLRGWAAEHDEAIGRLVTDGWVLYGEWLWVAHGTAYDALPDWLVVLDCWHESVGFATVEDRDRRVAPTGLLLPPRRFDGVLGSKAALLGLFGPSAYSDSSKAEGLVLRAADGARCKVVDPAYRRMTDGEWDVRRHNRLAKSDTMRGVR